MIMLKADTEDHILELKNNEPTKHTHTHKKQTQNKIKQQKRNM